MFSGLEKDFEDGVWVVEGGLKRAGRRLSRLDASWVKNRDDCLSVMCVLLAASPVGSRGLAKEIADGMLSLMGRMREGWESAGGNILVNQPEDRALAAEAKLVDKASLELSKKGDSFQVMIQGGMLSWLPKNWSLHFRSLFEAKAMATKELDSSGASAMVMSLASEQERMYNGLLASSQKVFSSSSIEFKRAEAWVEGARQYYEGKCASGRKEELAMVDAIEKFGFPNAAGECDE